MGARSESLRTDMPPLTLVPLLAAPAWIWATLLMACFVALSVLTIALARVAVRERPPRGKDERSGQSSEDAAR